MVVADTYLGSVDESEVQGRLDEEESLAVTLDETERRRSRVRTTADDGTPIGIVVGRELRDGDVLAAEDTLVVVSLAEIPALVIDIGGVADGATGHGVDSAALTALELGHAVGNRHWDLAVDGSRAYLPATDDRDRMVAEVDPYLPAGATVGYADVSPALFDDGATAPDHSHSHNRAEADNEHGNGGHGHGHEHAHDHDDHEHLSVRGVTDDGRSRGDES